MCGLEYIKIKVIIGKDSTADRSDADDLLPDAERVNAFRNKAVHEAVAAAGAVPECSGFETFWPVKYFFHASSPENRQ